METTTTTHREREGAIHDGAAIGAGAVAGIIAGIVMALIAMIRASAIGVGFWLPMQNVAATWYGVETFIAGPEAVVVGVLTHLLLVSAAWGALFGLVLGRMRSVGTSLFAGLVLGVVMWLAMTYLALPWLNETMAARVEVQPLWFWVGIHLVFGAVIGVLFPALARAFAGGRAEREEKEVRYESGAEPVAT